MRKSPTLLTHPLVRDSRNAPFRKTGWDEALDRVANGLERNRGAFGMLSSARATNETNYLAQKFARTVMGTHNVDSCDRARRSPSVTALAAVFGSAGGTSSYEEFEHTDVVVLWGCDPRSAQPVLFERVLKGIRDGARLHVVDPRRTAGAAWAESWLGLDVGTDIPLAHAIGREILHSGLANETFIGRATSGFEDYRALVEAWTPSLAERVTGVPADGIRQLAHAYARAERAQLCWGPGVTLHHNGTDTVRALINLSLLTGQVGRYGAGLQFLSGRNGTQGGGDMGALPHRLPGFQDILDPGVRRRFESAWGTPVEPHYGLGLAEMFEAMEEGTLRAVHCVGDDPARSETDRERAVRRLRTLDFLVVQDTFLTRTAQLADVVLPTTAAPPYSEGTTTNGEGRVQRVRRVLSPPGEMREGIAVLRDLAARLGHGWTYEGPEAVWNELRSLSPDHYGMTYARLEEHGGVQGPCPHTERLEPACPHGRLWERDPARRGRRAPFGIVQHIPSADRVDEHYPVRLAATATTNSPPGHGIELAPEDAERYEVAAGEEVQVSSRHGSVVASVKIDPGLRPGLAFLARRSPDEETGIEGAEIEGAGIEGAGIEGTAIEGAAIRIGKLPITTIVG